MRTGSATFTTSSRTSSASGRQIGFWLLLGGVGLLSIVLPGSPLLGEWESLSVFTIFGAQSNDMAFIITRDANIGGQGYPLLEISRHLIDWLHLPYTLDLVRLPVKLIGAGGLVAFAIVARRWFGPWPALAATALLAVNPIYHQYQNELIIAGPSLVAFIVLVERLQYLARRPSSWFGWLTMALVWALLLTMYGPSRIFATILVFAWLVFVTVRVLRSHAPLSRSALALRSLVTVTIVPAILLVASPGNLQYFNRKLFFPGSSETTFVQSSVEGLIGVLSTNAHVMLESFILGGGDSYHSSFIEATLIQGRFATIPLILSPVTMAALVFVLWQGWVYRRSGMNRYLAIVGLAALTTLPMLTSSVFPGESGPDPTLVNHRLAYFLLPAYLAIASLAASVATRSRPWRIAGALIAVGLVVAGSCQILIGHANFETRAAAADPYLTGVPGQAQWLAGYGYGGKGVSQGSHFQQHEQYARWAEQAALAASTQPRDNVLLVSTSIACFPEAPLETHTLGELREKNFHGMFLGLYLANALGGDSVGYVNLPSADAPEGAVMFKTGVFSGPLAVRPDGTIDYVSPDKGLARIMAFGSADPQVIVTTTPTELEAARAVLDTQGRAYRVLESSLPCWG